LCEATGALAAVLVDGDGETVDYASLVDPFDMKLAGAEWEIVLSLLKQSRAAQLRETHEVWVRAVRRSFAAVALPEGYALVVVMPRHAFIVSRRALMEASLQICLEAGLPPVAGTENEALRWARVRVKTSRRNARRPVSLWHGDNWCRLTLLGRYLNLDRRELGFRARLTSGAEFALVREPLGYWYAGDL
jgi:hypothetical protein